MEDSKEMFEYIVHEKSEAEEKEKEKGEKEYATNTGSLSLGKRTPSPYILEGYLKESVEKYIAENPEKVKLAQSYGEFLMSTKFANTDTLEVDGEDTEGNSILFNDIVHRIQFYGIFPDELHEWEMEFLKKVKGDDWKKFVYDLVNATETNE